MKHSKAVDNVSFNIYKAFKTPRDKDLTSIIGFGKIIVATIAIILIALAIFVNIPHSYPVNKVGVYATILAGIFLLIVNIKLISDVKKYPLSIVLPMLIVITILAAGIVHFTGNIRSPFFFLYFLPIIAAGWRFNPNVVFIPTITGVLLISIDWTVSAFTFPDTFSEFIKSSPYPAAILRSLTLVFVATFVYFLARLRYESRKKVFETISMLTRRGKELEIEKSKSVALSTTLTNIGDGVFIVDNKNKILDWNRAMEKITGINVPSAIGKDIYDLLTIYDHNGKPVCICANEKCPKKDNISNNRGLIIHNSSQLFAPATFKNLFVNHVSAPLFDSKDKLFASVQIVHNAEHEKQLADMGQLSYAITHITSLNETVEAIVPLLSKNLFSDKAIIVVFPKNSPAVTRSFGFNKKQNDTLLTYIPSDLEYLGQKKYIDPNHKIFTNSAQTETPYDPKILKELQIKQMIQLPLLKQEKVFGCVIVINKRLGKFERQDQRYLQTLASNVAKIIENAIIYHDLSASLTRERKFIADVAHEFKTPLTATISEIELAIVKERSIRYYHQVLESVLSNITHLSSRLKGILDLTWSQTIKGQDVKEIDVSALIDDIKEIAEKLAAAKKIQVESKVNGKALISANRERLAQAILNLVDNAIKYTPRHGKVQISVSKKNSIAKIKVADTGIGIPQSELPQIFDRFYRGLKHDRRLGSGLGLAITKSIVTSYKGNIKAKSKVGRGTEFTLTFPQTKL